MLYQSDLWDFLGHAIASFIGCYKIAQETESKFVPETVPWCNSTQTRPRTTHKVRIDTNGAPTSYHDSIYPVSLEQYDWFKHRRVIRIIVVASKMKWRHKPPSVLFFTKVYFLTILAVSWRTRSCCDSSQASSTALMASSLSFSPAPSSLGTPTYTCNKTNLTPVASIAVTNFISAPVIRRLSESHASKREVGRQAHFGEF